MTEQAKESQERCMRLANILYKTIDDFVDVEGSLDNREAFSVLSSMMIQVFCAQFTLSERKEKFSKFCEAMIKPGSPLYQDSIPDLQAKASQSRDNLPK